MYYIGTHDEGDRYVCNQCLGTFTVPPSAELELTTLTRGASPIRVVLANGDEVHRCAVPPSRAERRLPGPGGFISFDLL